MIRVACTCALVVLSSVAASASRVRLDIPGSGSRRLQRNLQGLPYAPQPAKSPTLIPEGSSCYPIEGNWACDEGLVCYSPFRGGIVPPGTDPIINWNPHLGIGPVINGECRQPIKKGGSCYDYGGPCASGLTCEPQALGNGSSGALCI